MASSSDTAITPGTARSFVLIEKYALPLVYGWLAWQRWRTLRELPGMVERLAHAPHPPAHLREIYFARTIGQGLLLAMMIFIGLALLLNRAPRSLPTRLAEVLVPLAASFYFVFYAGVDYLPDALRINLFPDAWQPACALAGLVLSAAGYAGCLWAMWHLRRSFALLVSVREVVLGGPYQFVRHPIYLGYFLDQGGLVLANGSLGMGLLALGFVMFQVQRAALEEAKLGEESAEYRRYAQRTGFMWPRW